MKIIAFPYAFGASSIFYDFKRMLEKKYDFQAIDYPAHGARIFEDPLYTIADMVNDAFDQIKGFINEPYCFLGYSMGGVIAFELYKKLKIIGMPLPMHMFIFATCEPSYKYKNDDFENYKLDDVKNILRELEGTSEEILADDEIITLCSPAVKADSIALQDYTCVPEDSVNVDCGVTVVRGSLEEDTEKCCDEWEKYLHRKINYIVVEGDHFFLFNEGEEMVSKLSEVVSSSLEVIGF